ESPLKTTARFEKPEKDLGFRELLKKIDELKDQPYLQGPFVVERHKRFAFPVAALVFALVGFPLAVRSHRGGRSIALVGSLVILVAYYVVLTSLEGPALRVRVPVWLAIWAPNIIFSAIGAVLLAATTREWRMPG